MDNDERMRLQNHHLELLSPARDAGIAREAILHGADAVYMGGTRFGMRAAPKNFSDDELARAVSFAHENGVKVYLTCNIIIQFGFSYISDTCRDLIAQCRQTSG